MRLFKVFLTLLILIIPITISAQEEKISDLKSSLRIANDDTLKVNILLSLSEKLYQSTPLDAMEYSVEAKALAQKLSFASGEAYAYKFIGLVYYFQGEYLEATTNWDKALIIFETIDDKEGMSNMLSNLGVIYEITGYDAKSLELYFKSLKLAKDINDTIRMVSALNNIGLVYGKKKNSEYLAVENFQEAIVLSTKINYYEGIGSASLNLGEFYYFQEKYDTALTFFENSLVAYRKTSIVNITGALTYMGKIYVTLGDFDNAILYQEEAINISKKLGARLELAKSMLGLAETYYAKGDFKKAIVLNSEAKVIAEELDVLIEKITAIEGLAKTYAKVSDFKNGYYYLEEARKLNNAFFTEKSDELLSTLRFQYELDNMLEENENLKNEIDLSVIKNKQQKTIISLLFLGFIVTTFFIVLLFRLNKQRKRANTILADQNELITGQKKEITDSIQYARRIQNAMLTPAEEISGLLPEHFILFRPRDIVSGDFYWITEIKDRIVCIVADSTGHGVPGAFMSMLGISFLNEIVSKKPDISANQLLDELRNQVIVSLRQTGRPGDSQDGMDITALIIDNKNKSIEYAGANNPLFIYRKGELLEFKPDKMPVGIHQKADVPFTNHKINIEKGDVLYTFSDGLPDQFGGPFDKKFMVKNFKNILSKIHNLSMSVQKQKLENTLDDWMKQTDQIDDILVMGIRLQAKGN